MFGLERHQHRCRQESLAAGRQPLLVAASEGRQLAGQVEGLAQLVQEAVDDGDHIHIPGVDVPPLGCILEQSDGHPGPLVPAVGHRGRSLY